MYSLNELKQLNKPIISGNNDQKSVCALDSNKLSVIRRFNLCKNIEPTRIELSKYSTEDTLKIEPNINTGKIMTDVPHISAIETFDDELNIGERIPRVDGNALKKIIDEFYLNPMNIEVKPLNYEMNIRLTSDVPFHCVPRRLSYFEKNEMQEHIKRLLDEKIIRPSDSPYTSAIVLVKKKDGKTRMCIDTSR